MRNIPMFVTENGAASLTLDQIPYQNAAYVHIMRSVDPEAFLQECCDFCRAAGAKTVYAWGDPVVEKYPFYTSLLLFAGKKCLIQDTEFVAELVRDEDLENWRRLYNEGMAGVAGAAYMTVQKARQYWKNGSAYLVRDPEGDLCGIGIVEKDTVGAVVSLYHGMGGDIFAALCQHIPTEQIRVEVASTNERAVRLYCHQGMECIGELSRLHKII